MPASDILIQGAREHNLQDVHLVLPRNQLICFTGVSGSGKSSLAFDTLFAEGQRRYVESLSSNARYFLGEMPKPDVDRIAGLSPAISISQKSGGLSPRSTVGTITEIYDYLRVLYARVGRGHCPRCGRAITAQTREQIAARIGALPAGTRFMLLAPLLRQQKGEHRDLLADLLRQGFMRARVDGAVVRLSEDLRLSRQARHDIDVVIDRLVAGSSSRSRVAEAVELGLQVGQGQVIVVPEAGGDGGASGPLVGEMHLSADYACAPCGLSFRPPSPRMFSFNSPQGMCRTCEGLGEVYTFDPQRLIPDPAKSFQQGAIELLGKWREMGRWKRHIFQGVAEALERKYGLEPGTVLETAWEELAPEIQRQLLWGTGDEHITFTWRSGPSGYKWGGTFEGIIPQLLSQYRNTSSRIHRRMLERYMSVIPCGDCQGQRLNPQARAVRLTTRAAEFRDRPERSLPEVCRLPVTQAEVFFSDLDLDEVGQKIAAEVLKEVRARLGFLKNVGLGYLSLDRTAPTLSGGEMQRIRLAGQIGSGLVGVLYILDEPSVGLHPRDNRRLLETMGRLRDQGNTVVIVEHDEDTMRAADWVVDFGPGPGVRGGQIVAAGRLESVAAARQSVTGQYLRGERQIPVPRRRRPGHGPRLVVRKASHNNLKDIDVEIPLGMFVCVTGVSGSGKSSLVNDILAEALKRDLNRGEGSPGAHAGIEGLEHLDKMIAIDQSPIGRTPRSNPATYIKLFDDIRNLFAQLPISKARGYKPGRFSFNVAGGRCEACDGNGANRLEMDFLADIWVTCPVCEGRRFNRETLQVRYKGRSIAQVLEMDVQEALEHFANIPKIHHKLKTLHDVGLGYMKLGQPSPTLSGGEAQRVKLARELVKKSTGRTLYLLDEPTTGLHFADVELLLRVLHGFVDAGNTVVVVEHNMEVIKTADWIIDLGPEGGEEGGWIVAAGTPEQVARVDRSHTGRVLRSVLEGKRAAGGDGRTGSQGLPRRARLAQSIRVRGAAQHNLKKINARIPRERITVCCGPSGSGKTSLAMDTIYAEGQRRYVESLSAYARQFVGQMQKPKVEQIEGLSPAVAIEQKHLGHNPRSTVGTVTEVYDYLRILMARLGEPYCPECDVPIGTQSADEIIAKVMAAGEGTCLYLMAPLELQPGQAYETLWEELRSQGYLRVRIDKQTFSLDDPPRLDRKRKYQLEVVVDRVMVRPEGRGRVADSVENALALGRGVLHVARMLPDRPETEWPVEVHSQHFACQRCGRSFEPLTPHHFSFNSPLGWCPECKGLGVQIGMDLTPLIGDPKRSVAEGAISVWPRPASRLFAAMLRGMAQHVGLPVDVPYHELAVRHRRLIMRGSEQLWFEARDETQEPPVGFRFQYRGLYRTADMASRAAPSLRRQLDKWLGEVECSACGGSRLRDDAAAVRLRGRTVDEICQMPLDRLLAEFRAWQLTPVEKQVAGELVEEIRNRLQFLVDVGLEYLTLARPAPTLSGGEMQRIRLAAQLGSGLCGVLYVLDEPTIGLHPRDNQRLLGALAKLRDLGNTLLVVEHDRQVVRQADHVLDFGPGAGQRGGRIVAQGPPDQVCQRQRSVTGPYLSGAKAIPVPARRRMASAGGGRPVEPPGGWLEVIGASQHNLKNIDVRFPLGTLTVVTGVSGSGKSSLVDDVLYAALARRLHQAKTAVGAHREIRGVEQINKVIRVDQQPLGQTPTSNPATFTGLFDWIRYLFSQLPEARLRGFGPRRFSFNVPGGRCEKCQGNGQLKIEMHFLPDVWIPCDACGGKRYEPETLAVRYRGRSIADVLEMSCGEALKLFDNIPRIRRILQLLCDVGLDYVALGQPAPTLSGGEAQRVKLAAELARPDTGRTLYLLDEPTTGLHFQDLVKLLDVLHRLVELGNTVVVIEHNLDVIKSADWVIDLGPEAGQRGGYVVVAGTPEDVVDYARRWRKKTAANGQPDRPRSYTGEVLEPVLEAGPREVRQPYGAAAAQPKRQADLEIEQLGKDYPMPWQTDGRRWHTRDRVCRSGEPCRWDGRILAEVVDRIQASGLFSPTDWNSRTVVEIRGKRKSTGWFFHAITGEPWLLKMKFRTARNTFRRDALVRELDLKPLNEMPELPIYGREPRVRCSQLRGPWQEIELRVHSYKEIDRREFWSFLDRAIAGFENLTRRAEKKPEVITPWKVLGRKWHLASRGFPLGKPPQWDMRVLEQLLDLLARTAPQAQLVWENKQVVPVYVPGQREPWAAVQTKKPDALHLTLSGPKGRFPLGRIQQLGHSRRVDADRPDRDLVRISFRTLDDLRRGDLPGFLREHLASVLPASPAANFPKP